MGGAPASDTSVLDREGADTSTSRTNGRSQLHMGSAGSPLMTARSTFVSTHVKELPAALACILAASGRQRLRCGTPGCDRTPAIVCAACDTALGWCMVCDDNRHSRPVVLHRRVHLDTGEVLAVGPVCGHAWRPPTAHEIRACTGRATRATDACRTPLAHGAVRRAPRGQLAPTALLRYRTIVRQPERTLCIR